MKGHCMKKFFNFLVIITSISSCIHASNTRMGLSQQQPSPWSYLQNHSLENKNGYIVLFSDDTGIYPENLIKQITMVQMADEAGFEDKEQTLDLSQDVSKKIFDILVTILADPTFEPDNYDDLLEALLVADFLFPSEHPINENLIKILIKKLRKTIQTGAFTGQKHTLATFTNTLTNKHAQLLIRNIKEKAVTASHYRTLNKRIGYYILGEPSEDTHLPVPDYKTGKPKIGSFPISIKDLIDTHLIPEPVNLELNLSCQGLTSLDGLLDIPNLQSFTTLKLDYNQLTVLPVNTFKNLPSLENLYLSFNHITTLRTHVFDTLPALQSLWLGNNKLISIEKEAFANLPALQSLSLQFNMIKNLPANMCINVPSLGYLVLNHNLLHLTEEQIRKDNNLPDDCSILVRGPVRVYERATGNSTIATVENGYLDPETHELLIPKGGHLSEDGEILEVLVLYMH